jgi:hypothetical protein
VRAAGDTWENGVDVASVPGVDVTGGGWNGVFVDVTPSDGVKVAVGTFGVEVAGIGVVVGAFGVDVLNTGVPVKSTVVVGVVRAGVPVGDDTGVGVFVITVGGGVIVIVAVIAGVPVTVAVTV